MKYMGNNKLPLLCTRRELGAALGKDPRSIALPEAVARLVAGRKVINLYAYPVHAMLAALHVNTQSNAVNPNAQL